MKQPCVYILASKLYGTLYIGVTSNLIARLWQHRNGEYILASKLYGTLYIGVTSNLIARLWQHRNGEAKGFTSKYRIYRCV